MSGVGVLAVSCFAQRSSHAEPCARSNPWQQMGRPRLKKPTTSPEKPTSSAAIVVLTRSKVSVDS
jgi:hypothetical protein